MKTLESLMDDYIKSLNNIAAAIDGLKDVDEFTYQLYNELNYYALQTLKAIAEHKTLDVGETLDALSNLLGFSIEDLVDESIRRQQIKREVKGNTENLSSEDYELMDQVLSTAKAVDDKFIDYSFLKVIQ